LTHPVKDTGVSPGMKLGKEVQFLTLRDLVEKNFLS
jgi:hypothetical protein